MSYFALTLPLPLLIWMLWWMQSLAFNYASARKTGVPILVRYITPTNPLWMVFGNLLIKACAYSPFGNGRFTRFYSLGWAANDRYRVHLELGDVFMLVTPGGNRLYVSDPVVALNIMKRRRDFGRDIKMMQFLSVYGENVFTAAGKDWQKHRKATMIAFADIDELVWQESLNQADILLRSWLQSTEPVRSLADDTKVLTSNAGACVVAFRTYVIRMVEEEKAEIRAGTRSRHNLVASLVRACKTHHPEGHRLEPGSDTTSITLATAILFLAAHPAVQEWIAEEVAHYTSALGVSHTDCALFPKLERCKAVMLETLRICHPVSQIIKKTGPAPETIPVRSKCIIIPPRTAIQINMSSLQTDPNIWGEDSLLWKPRRWMEGGPASQTDLESETLLPDTKGSYMPWAIDQHVCPGKKYSQLELVAVIAKAIGEYEVLPALCPGESVEEARRRLIHIAMETESKTLLNDIKNPESAALVWKPQVRR
ncbi:cytochrome P450 [Byssothecium circinans]|uniref:Cytochrome P450 n=1 Tax=Byssothecium circinans TaxID=147558 RepID=A0A6A5TE28_9PLEO|nr:cytochrome P450 [Byssothecium circinans]